jgi:CMP-N-acetylneuraminic acid synthetase
MNYKIVALLPMKANSERVVGKNFKNFCGKPLFRWSLDTLLSVPDISYVVINTDAREILKAHGLDESERVKVRDRPLEICGDLVSMNDVIKDDISNVDADIFLMTHTTNPLLSKQSVENALETFKKCLKENSHDSLFTVNRVQERFYSSDAKPINHDPDNLIRTQDLAPWYQENSNLYLFTKQSFEKTGARIGISPAMLVTTPFESTDIDTPDDWDFAESVVNYYRERGIISL